MAAELTTDQSSNGNWNFRIRSSDGRILASGEDYPTEEDMKRGIEEARAVLRLSPVEQHRRTADAEGDEGPDEDLRAADE